MVAAFSRGNRLACALALLLAAPAGASCGGGAGPDTLFRDGDVILQRGTGAVPEALARMLRDPAGYCHAGIVVVRDGRAFVAHIEPGSRARPGRARLDPIERFLASWHTRHAALYRLRGPDPRAGVAAAAAARFADEGRDFDWNFDRADARRLYCTELVWRAYLDARCPLVRERDLVRCVWLGRSARVIAPSSLIAGGGFRLVRRLR